MAFREKAAWASLISMLVVYGLYFWSAFHAADKGVHFGGLLGTIVMLVMLQVILTAALAISAPKEARTPMDEREKLIELRAMRVAYSGLATGIAFACFFGAFKPPIVFGTNSLLFILVACEIMRSSCLIIEYRRGA